MALAITEQPLVTPDYSPIEDHVAIGNLRTLALVTRGGEINWMCLPELDGPSVFGSLLDVARGGHFSVTLDGGEAGAPGYVERTNVARATISSAQGAIELMDFLPLRGSLHREGTSTAPAAVHRVVRCLSGTPTARVEWAPRPGYARDEVQLHPTPDGCVATSDGVQLQLHGAPGGVLVPGRDGLPTYVAQLPLRSGDHAAITMTWADDGVHARPAAHGSDLLDAEGWLDDTARAWRAWLRHGEQATGRAWAGQWQDLLVRSELAMKLLIHGDSGGIAAAGTTSLPEFVGGVRNWDYRAVWIRDGAMTVQALADLGHADEAEGFLNWIMDATRARDGDPPDTGASLQIMYGMRGERELPEYELPHLEGWRRSGPVRIGNAAAEQRQLDVLGEIWETASELMLRGYEPDAKASRFLCRVADEAAATWRMPDNGLWEQRCEPAHHLHSKMSTWAALQDAAHHARAGRLGPFARADAWSEQARLLRQAVLEHGVDPRTGALRQAFDRHAADAATLEAATMEFTPVRSRILEATIEAVDDELAVGELVYRYRNEDGLPGGEGTFALCAFWRVDALVLTGRIDEAREAFEALAARASPAGLFAEQIDAATGEFRGNFPQAFTHLGLINSLVYLAHHEGLLDHIPPPRGTTQHRALRA
jgi:GH15 family glucan-1,4-alpha-glucosidase